MLEADGTAEPSCISLREREEAFLRQRQEPKVVGGGFGGLLGAGLGRGGLEVPTPAEVSPAEPSPGGI